MIGLEQKGKREKEPSPRIMITLFGFEHHPLNLQVVPVLIQHAKHSFEGQGVHTYYQEAATNTPSNRSKLIQNLRDEGYAGFEVASQLLKKNGYVPSKPEIRAHREKIEASTVREIVEKKLLGQNELLDYFLGTELDILRIRYPFEIDMEVHSDSTNATTRQLKDVAMQFYDRSMAAVRAADPTYAIETFKQYLINIVKSSQVRDFETVKTLKEKIKTLEKKGGSIFLPFGSYHTGIITELKKALRHAGNIVFEETLSPGEQQLRDYEISLASPSDHDAARLLLKEMVLNRLETKFMAGQDAIAHHFEDLQVATASVVFPMSQEEVTAIIAGGESEFQTRVLQKISELVPQVQL